VTPAGVRWVEEIASTQDEAHRLAVSGAPHGTAIAARIQSGGRGTRGRSWASGEGGLWMSVVCRPAEGSAVEVVSLRIGLKLAVLLDQWLTPPNRITLKWPNDLYLGQRKTGGILTEARWQGELLGWLVIGIGLNVRNKIPHELSLQATRLSEAGVSATPKELAGPVAEAVAEAASHASPLTEDELFEFRARDWLIGRAIVLPEPGVAEGITAEGRLRVRTNSGDVAEVIGSVQLAAPS
jgi:BirA family biotin operon repressor/biotin-[acetyl-CoA-carboxylase] ligase